MESTIIAQPRAEQQPIQANNKQEYGLHGFHCVASFCHCCRNIDDSDALSN